MCRYDVTKAKSTLKEELDRAFEPSLAAWVLLEMADNREKDVAKRKAYDLPVIMDCLKGHKPLEQHWGCSDLLDRLQRKPELLQLT